MLKKHIDLPLPGVYAVRNRRNDYLVVRMPGERHAYILYTLLSEDEVCDLMASVGLIPLPPEDQLPPSHPSSPPRRR